MRAFLDTIPARLRPTIGAFCSDMWEGYLNAVEEFIASDQQVKAKLVIDRFHVAQHYRDGFDQLRKQEMKRLKQELPPQTYQTDCKGTLWLLRHNHADLDTQQRQQLRRFLAHSPNCHLAYTLREELTAIFEKAMTKEQAVSWLIRWQQKVKQQGLSCFNKFLTTLQNHWEYITNYFIQRMTSGFVEGINNKIQTIKRRCYGIRRLDTLFRRIWLDLQGVWRFGLTPISAVNPLNSK